MGASEFKVYGFRALLRVIYTLLMENQMEKKMENDIEAAIYVYTYIYIEGLMGVI